MKIRNKVTGEVREVNSVDLPSYGLSNPTSASISTLTPTPETQQPQGNFMENLLRSRNLPIGASAVTGGVGRLAGPVGGVVGATAGYAGADVMRKELAGLLGISGVPPGIASGIDPSKGEGFSTVKDTASNAVKAGAAQATGEGLAYGLKFLKPGTVSSFLAKTNDLLAKKTGFAKIDPTILETRFMNEVIPKAMRFTQGQGEDVVQAGENLIAQKIKPVRIFDAQELNHLRKNLNAISEGADGMKKALLDGLAQVVREEQLKVAPATGVTLPLQKAAYQIPQALKAFWPTRLALMGLDAFRSLLSGPLAKFAKYGGAPLIQGAGEPNPTPTPTL